MFRDIRRHRRRNKDLVTEPNPRRRTYPLSSPEYGPSGTCFRGRGTISSKTGSFPRQLACRVPSVYPSDPTPVVGAAERASSSEGFDTDSAPVAGPVESVSEPAQIPSPVRLHYWRTVDTLNFQKFVSDLSGLL